MPVLAVLLPLVQALPKVVAAAPEFVALFNQLISGFKQEDQDVLKAAYREARDRSDSAEADFIKASRGEE